MNYKLRGNFTTDPRFALKEVLENRGVKDVEKYLNPSIEDELNPYDLNNIKDAAEMIIEHIKSKSKICLVVDSDMDGLTSSSILYNYIKEVIDPDAKITPILHEGKQHGLDDHIDWLEEQDFDLVLVPDAGSYDKEEMERLAAINIDVVALDHHEPTFDEDGSIHIIQDNPHCIIVNNQLSPYYSNKDFCGAGIVYKLCEVFDNLLEVSCARNYIDLAALGNIADVMNQSSQETRSIIIRGLNNIRNEGFSALLDAQSYPLKEKAKPPYIGLTPVDVAFYIAPLMNAIMRMGTMSEKEVMFKAFTSPDELVPSTKRGAKPGDMETAAEQNARVAGNVRNRQNKAKERAIGILEARIQEYDLLSDRILFLIVKDEDKIPNEITGLVAQYFVGKYGRPVLLGRESDSGEYRGSIRNNSNFEALPDFKGYLEETGEFSLLAGHASAAGFSLPTNNLQAFLKKTNSDFDDNSFQNCYIVDYALPVGEPEIDKLFGSLAIEDSCWGNGVDEPKVIVKDIPIINPFFMGKDKDSTKLEYNGLTFVKFKDTDFVEEISNHIGDTITVYGKLNLNTFAGRTTVQIFLDDYEIKQNGKFDF